MVRIVVDPGVLIAAVIAPNGVCAQVVQRVIEQRCALIVCPALLAELEEVLARPKFRRYLSLDEARRYVLLVGSISEHHPDPVVESRHTADPDDDYLVALAQQTGVDVLVAGDPHLTKLESPRPPVLPPRAFLEYLTSLVPTR